MPPSETEVLIVGSGPTGLMLACQLLRFNVKFRIIDKNADRSKESRAFGIQARSMEIFQNLGIVDQFLEKSQVAYTVDFYLHGMHKLELNFGNIKIESTPFPHIFFLAQPETERILIGYIEKQGIKIERQTQLEKFKQRKKFIEATIKNTRDGSTQIINCLYLAGCDGAHSSVREILKIPFIGEAYEQDFFLADAKVQWPATLKTGFKAFFDKKGVFLHAPLEENLTRLIGAELSDLPFQKKTTPITLEEIENFASEVTHTPLMINQPVWMSRFYLHHRVVKQYQKDRTFLVGDAAHIHSPVGAQGMNTGLQDAANLAWKLAGVLKFNMTTELLDTYQTERQFIGEKLTHTTDRFFWFMTTKNKILTFLRPSLLSLMMMISKSLRLQKRIFWLMSQLGIYYPKNKFLVGEKGFSLNLM